MTPLAEGFDPERRVENAASLRVTNSGLTFLEGNLGTLATALLGSRADGGILTFPIPPSSPAPVDLFFCDLDLDVCPGTPAPEQCEAEIDIGGANLTVTPQGPHNIVIAGPLPLRVQDLPLAFSCGIFSGSPHLTLGEGDLCPGDNQPFADIELDVNVSIEIDTDPTHSRAGYSRVRVNTAVDESALLDSIYLCGNNVVEQWLYNAIVDLAGGFIIDPLLNTINDAIEAQLCQQAKPMLDPSCPTGTVDVDGVCRYGNSADAECASIILGVDGKVDLGALFASFSPGAKGGFDFLLAAGGDNLRDDGSGYHWGDLNPTPAGPNAGISLGLYGGAEPTPVTGCVPLAQTKKPIGIPFPDELLENDVAGWPMGEPPHLGLALSQRFTNYLLAQAYNSGALCLAITSDSLGDTVPLTTPLVSLILTADSLNELGLQQATAQVAIMVRPQSPPKVTFGNGTDIEEDPNVLIELDQLSLDFYVWSLDRFIRVLTASADVAVPMNIIVTPDGLQPVVENLRAEQVQVTNAELLREDPVALAAAVQELITSLVGGALGSALPPIDLGQQLSGLGIELVIPPSMDGQGSPGLRRLNKPSNDPTMRQDDAFLGIFASFATTTANAVTQSDTHAELTDFYVDPAGLQLASYQIDNGPVATLLVGSSLDDGNHTIEWQYKVDKGPWHPFTRNRHLRIADPWLRAPGRHTVLVRSRVIGDVHSLDAEPAEVELVVEAPSYETLTDEPRPITPGEPDADGCACAMPRSASGQRSWWLGLLLGLMVLRRRYGLSRC